MRRRKCGICDFPVKRLRIGFGSGDWWCRTEPFFSYSYSQNTWERFYNDSKLPLVDCLENWKILEENEKENDRKKSVWWVYWEWLTEGAGVGLKAVMNSASLWGFPWNLLFFFCFTSSWGLSQCSVVWVLNFWKGLAGQVTNESAGLTWNWRGDWLNILCAPTFYQLCCSHGPNLSGSELDPHVRTPYLVVVPLWLLCVTDFQHK